MATQRAGTNDARRCLAPVFFSDRSGPRCPGLATIHPGGAAGTGDLGAGGRSLHARITSSPEDDAPAGALPTRGHSGAASREKAVHRERRSAPSTVVRQRRKTQYVVRRIFAVELRRRCWGWGWAERRRRRYAGGGERTGAAADQLPAAPGQAAPGGLGPQASLRDRRGQPQRQAGGGLDPQGGSAVAGRRAPLLDAPAAGREDLRSGRRRRATARARRSRGAGQVDRQLRGLCAAATAGRWPG